MNKILILDDEQNVRRSFADYFEDRGWQVSKARSAEEGLKILTAEDMDAAIVDIRLHGMNGHEFIQKCQEMDKDLAFVICTGSPEYFIPADLLDQKTVASRVFKKPVSDLNLLEIEVLKVLDVLRDKDHGP